MSTSSTGTPPRVSTAFGTTGCEGWDVPSIGRRVAARILDGLFGVLALGAALVPFFVLTPDPALLVAGVLYLSWLVFCLYAELGLAATPGQLALGLKQLDHATGRPAGGRTFAKYLLMGLLGQITLGIILVLSLFSMSPPLRRSWFDRMAGVTVGQRVTAPHEPPRTPAPTSPPIVAAPPARPRPSAPPSSPPRTGVPGSTPPPDWALVEVPATPGPDGSTWLGPVPAGHARSSHFVLDDGASLAGGRTYVLGRDPVAPTSHPDAVPRWVVDPGRSLSKTHLVVGVDADGPWVTDLHSTNGVRVSDASGNTTTAVPGRRTPVPDGGVVKYGQRTLRVHR